MGEAGKILVVDDSALMRKHLRRILQSEGYSVDIARNGVEALEKLHSFDPAVITLDINMPEMDGLTCLSHIMTQAPRPVIMVSSLTERGALATFEALELGAMDFVAKPGGTVSLNMDSVAEALLEKISAAKQAKAPKSEGLRQRLKARRQKISQSQESNTEELRQQDFSDGLVVIGVSTGGPSTVETIVRQLDASFPLPIIVVQHMPARFTSVFAQRLNKLCPLTVAELNGPTELLPGHIWIARGDSDAQLIKRRNRILLTNSPVDNRYLWHPSVDRLLESAIALWPPEKLIGVQLTGMGNDGAANFKKLHDLGARTIAESEETAVVYGMCRELIDLGGADLVLPNHEIAEHLNRWVQPKRTVRRSAKRLAR